MRTLPKTANSSSLAQDFGGELVEMRIKRTTRRRTPSPNQNDDSTDQASFSKDKLNQLDINK